MLIFIIFYALNIIIFFLSRSLNAAVAQQISPVRD